jgi:hypothetical protein
MAHAAPLAPTARDFAKPPRLHNAEGRMRMVGVEMEYSGPTAEETARALATDLGGEIIMEDPHAFRVKGCSICDMSIELDSRMLHPHKDGTLLGGVVPKIAAWIGNAASVLVPCELVTAPVPIDRLHEVDRVIATLRRLGARGTQDGALFAFGLHFNPETPAKDARTIVSFLKAFVLLNAWLRKQVAPDPTREMLGFADPFPTDYMRELVAPDYWPDIPAFIDDYLAANPTRNRDLDLLPLLLHLDEARVRTVLPNEKIRGRPTFHYRLPDARVSDPGWSIAPDWNRWVVVERLADDPERLETLCLTYLAFEGEEKSWADAVERIALS